jgi:hypothetical protein
VRGFLSGASRCSARIERTPHPAPTALQHMRVDHRRSDVLVPQEFLHGPNIVTILQQVRSKAVPTLIVTLLLIRRWPRAVTHTIPAADKRWRWSDGDGARPRRVSSSSCLLASRAPWPRGCSPPSLVVSFTTHRPPACVSTPCSRSETGSITLACFPPLRPRRLGPHNGKECVRPKSPLSPQLPQEARPWPPPIVWPQLPEPQRQQCHDLMAQRLPALGHGAQREEPRQACAEASDASAPSR